MERLSGLQQLGTTEATKLEGQLGNLIGQVESDSALTSDERFDIEEVIRSADDELQSLSAKITADTLVDVLRADVLNVDSSTLVDAGGRAGGSHRDRGGRPAQRGIRDVQSGA